jgi:hypothetical protein
MIDLLCPTLKRPRALQPLADNIKANTAVAYQLYFGLEPDDEAGIAAARATGYPVVINKYSAGYSNTIQSLYEAASAPFFVHINDDMEFLPSWQAHGLACFDDPKVMVVGISERDNSSLSAVSIIRRSYIETMSGVIDMPRRVFYPYGHNYQDTELTETAKFRGVWAGADSRAIVHNHPGIIGGPRDYTYQKNDALAEADAELFKRRKQLWT